MTDLELDEVLEDDAPPKFYDVAPCDACEMYDACGSLHIACSAFFNYVNDIKEEGERKPDRETYCKIFDLGEYRSLRAQRRRDERQANMKKTKLKRRKWK